MHDITLKNMMSSTSCAFWSLMSHQLWMTGVTDTVKSSCGNTAAVSKVSR